MKKTLMIFSIGMLSILIGCKEQGCTEEKADNFSDTAEVDDESCIYSGDIVFWCDSARNRELIAEGFNTPIKISLYSSGDNIGSLNFYNYLSSEPSCDDDFSSSTYEESVVYNHKIEKTSEYLTIKFEDNTGKQMTNRIVTVNAGDCQAVKL